LEHHTLIVVLQAVVLPYREGKPLIYFQVELLVNLNSLQELQFSANIVINLKSVDSPTRGPIAFLPMWKD